MEKRGKQWVRERISKCEEKEQWVKEGGESKCVRETNTRESDCVM